MIAIEVFLDQLRDRGGDLVNISSAAGRVARAGFAAYAATKWGINGLRVELQPDVRVTVIARGAIATELAAHITTPTARRRPRLLLLTKEQPQRTAWRARSLPRWTHKRERALSRAS